MSLDRLEIHHRPDTALALLPPAGWRVLVPGLPHWFWGQRDQALIFFGFHVAATSIGLFSWGTWLGLLMLFFAYVAHAFSAADAIKQAAFPQFGPMVPFVAASLGLGVICYAPVMMLGSTFAWPVIADHRPREGYWVNRWAYLGDAGPQHGETVWLSATRKTRPRLAWVVAAEGQKVRWSEKLLRVDSRSTLTSLVATRGTTHALELTVPDRHVLVSYHDQFVEPFVDSSSWEIVAHDEVHGKAWALSYPVWDRRLLR